MPQPAPLRATREEPELILQTGHSWGISCSAFSPDGRRLATSSRDGTVKLWDVPARKLLRTMTLGGHGAQALSWSAGGSRLAGCDDNRTLWVWSRDGDLIRSVRASDQEETHTVPLGRGSEAFTAGHSFYLQEHPSRDGAVPGTSVEYHCFVRSQDMDTSRAVWTTVLDWVDVSALAAAPDFGTIVAVGYARRNHADIASGELAIVDGVMGKVRWSVTVPKAVMSAATYAPRGLVAVSGTDEDGNGKVWVWDTISRRLLRVLSLGALDAPSVGFAPDGNTLVVGLAKGREPPGYGLVQCWDAREGKLLRQFRDDRLTWPQVAVSPANGLVAVGAQTTIAGALVLLAPRTLNMVGALPGGASGIFGAQPAPDGSRLAFVDDGGHFLVWERETGTLRLLAPATPDRTGSFDWDTRGERLVTGNSSGPAAILDPTTGKATPLEGAPGVYFSFTFSPDGNRVIGFQLREFSTDSLVGGRRLIGDTWLWDAHTGRLIARLLLADHLSFSPSGKYLVGFSAHEYGELGQNFLGRVEKQYRATFTVWDAGSGALVRDMGPEADYRVLGASDRVLLSDSAGFAVTELNDGTTRPVAEPAGRYTVSADGARLLTAESSGTVRLIDTRSGRCLYTQPAPNKARITSVDLAPDGKTAVFGLDTGGAVLLNVESGETESLVAEGAGQLYDARFLAGGGTVLAHAREQLYAWQVPGGFLSLTLPAVRTDVAAPDGRSVMVDAGDGMLHVYDVRSGKERITLASFAREVGNPRWEWLAYTPDGRYVGSEGAERFIAWRLGNRMLPGNALRRSRRVPDLLKYVPWSFGARQTQIEEAEALLKLLPHWPLFVSPDDDAELLHGLEALSRYDNRTLREVLRRESLDTAIDDRTQLFAALKGRILNRYLFNIPLDPKHPHQNPLWPLYRDRGGRWHLDRSRGWTGGTPDPLGEFDAYRTHYRRRAADGRR